MLIAHRIRVNPNNVQATDGPLTLPRSLSVPPP